MINVKEDRSYMNSLDIAAIENGVAELGIHSLRISNFYTEEEKEENKRTSETMTREQWSERCEQFKLECGQKVEKIIDALNNNFSIYQYKNENIKYGQHDLFFWCNSISGKRDMSYVTLNPNTKLTNEQQKETIYAALELLNKMNFDGIQVIIQFKAIYNEEKVQDIISEYCQKMKDVMIEYGGYVGKIVEFNGRYVFKKKGAKKKAYEINKQAVLKNVFVV